MKENSEKILNYLPRKICPLCSSSRQELYIPFTDIPIVRCLACGFIFSARVMANNVLEEYYQKSFGSERHRQGQLINAKTNAWAVGKILDIGSIHSFLDIGAGYGFLLKELKERFDLQAIGVELSEQEVNYGLTHLKVDLRNCLLSDAHLESASCDVVACFEVIEHIQKPGEFIEELLQYLKPDGHLVIMTDNFESKVVRDLGAGFPKWIPHSHISHFGPSTLERLLKDKGLEITGRLSFTPWELLARRFYYKLCDIKKTPQDSFDLIETLKSEMNGTIKMFPLRRLADTYWAKVSAKNNLEGALMYLAARRRCI
jgi:2-polyprenyl-3-methyl-5-hydroxy-6-metoxy-1,4-benzoquinol methylase